MTVPAQPAPSAAAGDRRALVTGASSGIGAAFARALRARGRRLILVARREERLRRLADELGEEAVTPLVLDLALAGAAERLRQQVEERGLTVDLLVNNAGVGHTGPFHREPPQRILAMVDLNVRALVDLTRHFLPAMVQRGSGQVINVVSMSAFQPVPFLAVYGASKAFVLSFTEALATELSGTGVQVQALCPGLVSTEFAEVAGTDRVLFNRTGAMNADEVVAHSLRALERGHLRVIPGWRNRLTAAVQGWVPRSIVRNVAGRMFRPSAES